MRACRKLEIGAERGLWPFFQVTWVNEVWFLVESFVISKEDERA